LFLKGVIAVTIWGDKADLLDLAGEVLAKADGECHDRQGWIRVAASREHRTSSDVQVFGSEDFAICVNYTAVGTSCHTSGSQVMRSRVKVVGKLEQELL
jgi:hypothetical protein